jgi:hypothetical protein
MVLTSVVTQEEINVSETLRLSTRIWLLIHGGVLQLGATTITLVPLGLTAMVGLLLHGVGGYCGKQADRSGGDDLRRPQVIAKVVGVITATYASLVVGAALFIDAGGPNTRAGIGAILLSAVMSFLGSRKTIRWEQRPIWPIWTQAIPQAVGSGVLVAIIGGFVVLLTSLILNRELFLTLTDHLYPGWVGVIVLTLIQFFYSPNIIMWCTSWSFGPGFTIGDESVISLAGSHVGLLPAFPITAALPTDPDPASLAWLAIPVLAGAVAALMVLRVRPAVRFDETALVGGLSGVLAGLALVGLATLTSGSLGVDRLSSLGPMLLPLLVVAPSLMGLAGILTGLILGLVRKPVGPADPWWWSRWGTGTPNDEPTETYERATQLVRWPKRGGPELMEETGEPLPRGRRSHPDPESEETSQLPDSVPEVQESSRQDGDKPTMVVKDSESNRESEMTIVTRFVDSPAGELEGPSSLTKEELSVKRRMGWLGPVFQKAKKRNIEESHGSIEESTTSLNPDKAYDLIIGEQLPLDFHGDDES